MRSSLAPLFVAIPLAAASSALAVDLRMFLTSAAGTGDLSSWPEAGGFAGVAAGDAICQTRAAAAGLANPTAYRAWLSDSADDAYCRLHGLTGKRTADCGQATLPASAGPWWRTDGKPFGGTLHALLHPEFQVLHPPRIDELGAEVTLPTEAWTGTDAQGEADERTCVDWTSGTAANAGAIGQPSRTGYSWSTAGGGGCDGSRRLLCFETGTGDPLPLFPSVHALAFVTSAFGYGDLSAWPLGEGATGVAAGDQICRSLAADAGLSDPSTFKAWLSDGTTAAPDRLVHAGPWVRIDGIEVAASLADLLDGQLDAPINVMESGAYHINMPVWTGTLGSGASAAATCAAWTSSQAAESGLHGVANATSADWTERSAALPCDASQRALYCLQDTPLVLRDDFESGNLYGW